MAGGMVMLHTLVTKHEDWFVAQCLEYDIAVQAKSLDDLEYELQRMIMSHIAIASLHNEVPFSRLPAAPQGVWEKFQHARRLEQRPVPFRMPADVPPAYMLPQQEIRVA